MSYVVDDVDTIRNYRKQFTRLFAHEAYPQVLERLTRKSAEYEADRVGIVFSARAGYTPWGLPDVLQDLAGLPAKDSRTSLLYKTDPHPADRLAMLGEAVGGRLDAVRGKDLPGRFYRIQ